MACDGMEMVAEGWIEKSRRMKRWRVPKVNGQDGFGRAFLCCVTRLCSIRDRHADSVSSVLSTIYHHQSLLNIHYYPIQRAAKKTHHKSTIRDLLPAFKSPCHQSGNGLSLCQERLSLGLFSHAYILSSKVVVGSRYRPWITEMSGILCAPTCLMALGPNPTNTTNHILLRENETVKAIVGDEYRWRGSIVVMRAGKGEKKWVMNMWGHWDAVLADYALDQFVKHIQQRKRFSFPKHLVFCMP
ncbi:hypothetical protein ARMGADRAFT_1032471 [Armillaria gallica]|uniref:Uncharacterized protein n=1 Tax=Armillaria gallica TaxID=47427 RepID=A0A2H3DMY7_ARMGA|nr:hypothetical protein ARMGADRAFT_1032471 [Armillaria gallica]